MIMSIHSHNTNDENNEEFTFDQSSESESSASIRCRNSFLFNTILDESEFGPFTWLWVLFQLGNLILLLLFLLPNSRRAIWRLLAILFSSVLLTFGYFILGSNDLIIWSSIFCFINLTYLIVRISKWRGRFSTDTEQVYKKLFAPLRVSRSQFSQILSCKRSTRILHTGENYALEKQTRVDSLSLVVSGRLLVSQQGRPLHVILQHQFVDSPEYFGVSTDELFQVTITAVEESKILVWHRDKLRLTIMSDEFLRVMFDHIIGRDVVRKLIQVGDSVSTAQTNGYSTLSPPPTIKQLDTANANESEPMLTTDATKDLNTNQFGTTTLPFDTNEVWSLTKIDEEMTSV